jgi:hypothetical protein
MAKTTTKRSRQGIFSKAVNVGLIALGFSHVLEILFRPISMESKLAFIQRDATFGLSQGKFNLQVGLEMYSPAAAAVGLGALKSYLFRKFPVRR